jgi:hypothetical protein
MDQRIIFPDALAAMTADALLGARSLEEAAQLRGVVEQPRVEADADNDWAGEWYARARRILNDALRAASAPDGAQETNSNAR